MNFKRKSVTLFFCDVYGTVDGGFSDDDLKKFASLLEELKEENKSDYLFFGMSSTERPDVVDSYESALSRYFSDDVKVIEKFQDAEAIREAKIACALFYIEHLKRQYDIDSIYCADDIVILQEMFSETLSHMEGLELQTIIPKKGNNNLAFINSEIESRFIKKKPSYPAKK